MSRSGFLALALALPALSTCHATRELVSTGRAGGTGYRVVVAIVVDQLAAWVVKAGSTAAGHTVREVLDSVLTREFGGPGPWVAGVAGPFVYLTKPSVAPADQARLVRVAQKALRQSFGVRNVLDVRQVARTCSPDRADAFLCRSLPVEVAADLFVELDQDDFFDAELDPGLGTNHGSPRRFDRSVPLYLRAPGRVRAGTLVAEPLRFDAFTRTLASLLDLPGDAIAPTGRNLCQPLSPSGSRLRGSDVADCATMR